MLLGHTQAEDGVDHLQDDEGHDRAIYYCDADAHDLCPHLARDNEDGLGTAERRRREHAGLDRPDIAADRKLADYVERVVVFERALVLGRGEDSQLSRGETDYLRAVRTDESRG